MSRDGSNVLAMSYGAIAAGVLVGIAFLIHPVESPDAAKQISVIAADPDRWLFAHVLLLAGLACFVPVLLLMMRRLPETARRAASTGGILAFIGLVSAIAFVTVDGSVFWVLAKPGLDQASVYRVFGDLVTDPRLSIVFYPAFLLNVGVIVLAFSLFRSRVIPRWSSAALIAAMVVQVAFGFAYIHAAAAVAGLLMGVGFVGLGVDTIRRPATTG
jgi:hypothetical protein